MATTAIGTLGNIPTITVNGRVFTDLTTLITLVAYTSTAPKYSTFRIPNGSAGYQVTAGKTFTVAAVSSLPIGANGTSLGTIGWGDNDVSTDSNAAPTNFATPGNNQALPTFVAYSTASNGVMGGLAHPFIKFTMAATKYPSMYTSTGGASVMLLGYET